MADDGIRDRIVTVKQLKAWGYSRLTDWELEAIRDAAVRALRARVGKRIANNMSQRGLEEFGEYQSMQDERAMFRTIEAHGGDYQKILSEEIEALRTLLRASSKAA